MIDRWRTRIARWLHRSGTRLANQIDGRSGARYYSGSISYTMPTTWPNRG